MSKKFIRPREEWNVPALFGTVGLLVAVALFYIFSPSNEKNGKSAPSVVNSDSSGAPLTSMERARLTLLAECHLHARNIGLLSKKANSISVRWGQPPIEIVGPDKNLENETTALMGKFVEDLKRGERYKENEDLIKDIISTTQGRVLSNFEQILGGPDSTENMNDISQALGWMSDNCRDL